MPHYANPYTQGTGPQVTGSNLKGTSKWGRLFLLGDHRRIRDTRSPEDLAVALNLIRRPKSFSVIV